MQLAHIVLVLLMAATGTGRLQAQPLAFPGAEGFGKYTTGGRGGKVLFVTNLLDNGPGSFRQAAEAKGARIILFRVAGTIELETPLKLKGDLTIAGQSAPGGGICLANQPVSLGGDNIIIRFLRFRMGDKYQGQAGKVNGSGGDDALGGSRRKHIIIDHCSISWSTDECFSVYGGDSTTLQWNIISEPLNYSYHFETGDADFERHGYGGIWGGSHLSAHHNLFAHCVSRNPRFNGTRLGATEERVDFRNNVIYNWGTNNVYGGEGGYYNIVNNYYRHGPSTSPKVRFRIVNPSQQAKPFIDFGKFYVEGNVVEDAPEVSANNELGIHPDKSATPQDKFDLQLKQAVEVLPIAKQSAREAYKQVLQWAGAVLPRRDSLDERIISDVRRRRGRFIDVQGGYPHGTPFEQTRQAWPALEPGQVAADADNDGISDEWERKHKLDPNNPADAQRVNNHLYFTNLDLYLNCLATLKTNSK